MCLLYIMGFNIIFIWIMLFACKIKDRISFFNKKTVDFLVILLLNIVITTNIYYSDNFGKYAMQVRIIFLVGCTVLFFIGFIHLKYIVKNKNYFKRIDRNIAIISVVTQIFVSVSSTYLSLYYIDSHWFIIKDIEMNNFFQTIFEFMYYTFSVLLSYGDESIKAIGIIPRLYNIVYVTFSIFFLGNVIEIVIKEK